MWEIARMTRDELLARHRDLCEHARELMSRKNQDYGGGDTFGNFRLHGLYGIAVRLHDKVARLTNFAKAETFAVDESVMDTVLDLINYAILYEGFYADNNRTAGPSPTRLPLLPGSGTIVSGAAGTGRGAGEPRDVPAVLCAAPELVRESNEKRKALESAGDRGPDDAWSV